MVDRLDVFGPLAACGNCEKTKKNCTFDWLRSQRISQASQPQANAAPSAKRRRTQNGDSQPKDWAENQIQFAGTENGQVNSAQSIVSPPPYAYAAELGVTFGDFACGSSSWASDSTQRHPCWEQEDLGEHNKQYDFSGSNRSIAGSSAHLDILLDKDSGQGSSMGTVSEDQNSEDPRESSYAFSAGDEKEGGNLDGVHAVVARSVRKRRRRGSSCSNSNGALPYPEISCATDLSSSINRVYLTEGLLQIYHLSFENALACWLTDRTCPYNVRGEVDLVNSITPDWNRIYHRVARLDRLAASIRGRQLTFSEDRAASRSLDLAIFAFAAQWSHSGHGSVAKYPFGRISLDSPDTTFNVTRKSNIQNMIGFDQTLQVSTWHQADNALQAAGDIESFRVVLAQLVFAQTQKPVEDTAMEKKDVTDNIEECEDLMAKLNLTIDTDGPPVHLEKGLRLIHSLRSRMAMLGGRGPKTIKRPLSQRRYRSSAALEAADRSTVDLLFWLGIMFDTLSAAVHKRPLVVSDEDSNIYLQHQTPVTDVGYDNPSLMRQISPEDPWDEHLFVHRKSCFQVSPTRWPCSIDEAAALLSDAAPVKVLLFRKVTRIQTLLARSVQGERIEKAIATALEVIDHWKTLFAPFIQDCIENHDRLPARIQSWYICLCGHWYLAALLLFDLIEIVDGSGMGLEAAQNERAGCDLVETCRLEHCRAISDLARCACSAEEATFSQAYNLQFAVNQAAILTEPWTGVLIRAFGKAGVLLLEANMKVTARSSEDGKDAFRRASDCAKALWILGQKSDLASSAAKILSDALKQRRKDIQGTVRNMNKFLETELWDGVQGLEFDGSFGLHCEP